MAGALDGLHPRLRPVPAAEVLALRGDVDLRSAAFVRAWLAKRDGVPVVVDLTAVTFLDCGGAAPLREAHALRRRAAVPLTLLGPPPAVESVLRLLGLGEALRPPAVPLQRAAPLRHLRASLRTVLAGPDRRLAELRRPGAR